MLCYQHAIASYVVNGRWFDGDEKVPLKKRKGVVEKNGKETVLMLEEEKKMKPKMKPKMESTKKCSTSGMQQNCREQDKAGNDNSNSTPNNNSVKKMNKRGGAIMEGSRCSRVNGRGWRCCQQTLVGYSLCEHHLGKGRLRSIANVKGRTKVPTVAAAIVAPHNDTTVSTTNDSTTDNNTTTNDNQSSKKVLVSSSVVQPVRDHKDTILLDGSCYDDEDEDEDEDEDDADYTEEEMKKPLVVKKKRMKLGMVKARSLSSLLNQTN